MSESTPAMLHVAVVGLGFGAEFVPIYLDHPSVRKVTACDLDPALRNEIRNWLAPEQVCDSLEAVLADPGIDAVHLVTGLDHHADHVVAVLNAGKHVACTVPMALSYDEIEQILVAQQSSGRNYMMMETAVYTREYFYAQELLASGTLGEIVHARGTHYQDMTDWPAYWTGLPPMHYSTHAVSPLLRLLEARATRVRALGSGRLPTKHQARYGNPFPVESALIGLNSSDVTLEVTRTMFQVARAYTESFSLYGNRASFEWAQLQELGEDPVLFRMGEATGGRGRPIDTERITVPDRADLLPASLRRYTTHVVYGAESLGEHLSFLQGGGHGGSHPHLVHEFVTSIIEGRPSAIDAATAANWTATGIAAHMSAMRRGDPIELPTFTQNPVP